LIGWHPQGDPTMSCIYHQALPANVTRQRSVAEMIAAAMEKYSVVEVDNSTNGYAVFELRGH
jgi:hypothetical protein